MLKLILITLFGILLLHNSQAQDIDCEELTIYAEENGYRIGRVSPLQLFESSWLKEVVAYEIEDIIVVVASIKKDEFGFSFKKYIFCGIPRSNWKSFYSGIYDF